MTPDRCCDAPCRIEAHVPCRPWGAWYCENCGEISVEWGMVRTFLWTALVGWYWDGTVRINRSVRHADDTLRLWVRHDA